MLPGPPFRMLALLWHQLPQESLNLCLPACLGLGFCSCYVAFIVPAPPTSAGLSSITALGASFSPEELSAWRSLHFTHLSVASSYSPTLGSLSNLLQWQTSLVGTRVKCHASYKCVLKESCGGRATQWLSTHSQAQ